MAAVNTVKVTIDGVQHSLTYNATSGKWEATLTAPSKSSYNESGHYYNVSVTATDSASNTATINASNGTFGNALKLYVKEKVKPTIAVTSPGAAATLTNNTPSIAIQLRDSDSGINISTFSLKIDGGTAITSGSAGVTATPVAGGYDITYVPSALSDGSHTVTVNVDDFDGNSATAASRTFKVDTAPPTLNITTPANGSITNTTSGTVIGTTNDAVSSPVTVAIKVNSADVGAVTVEGDGSFSKVVTYAEGSNTIEIKATDGAGKTTTITRTITIDTSDPVFTSIEVIPNPVDAGQTFVIKVDVE